MSDLTRIKVGPFTYRMTFSQAAIDAASRSQEADLFGQTDHGALSIAITPDADQARQQDTVLHEVLHCLTRYTGITSDLEGNAEEKLVTRLAPALLDTLRRNPALVAYLLA